MSAKTVEEAIKQALARLGKKREEVEISVLSEGSRGILGIGAEEARILVAVRPPVAGEDEGAVARQVLEELLHAMGIRARIEVRHQEVATAEGMPSVTLDILGEDLGLLIGRRGETLSALQLITNLILSQKLHRWAKVAVDVEGYRQQREQSLKSLAQRMADRVRQERRPTMLEPMPPHERRIVHLALQDCPDVTTHSIGEGGERKVVISPKKS